MAGVSTGVVDQVPVLVRTAVASAALRGLRRAHRRLLLSLTFVCIAAHFAHA